MAQRPSVAIVGSGFSGLATAIGLKQAGYHDFTIFERTDGVGGVWRHNTYPGAACDVSSYLYSFSFEPNPEWARPFAPQGEIQAYLEQCVRKYGLSEHLRFSTEIVSAEFDAQRGVWRLETDAGEVHEADVFVPACGQLTRPSIPDIPGWTASRARTSTPLSGTTTTTWQASGWRWSATGRARCSWCPRWPSRPAS